MLRSRPESRSAAPITRWSCAPELATRATPAMAAKRSLRLSWPGSDPKQMTGSSAARASVRVRPPALVTRKSAAAMSWRTLSTKPSTLTRLSRPRASWPRRASSGRSRPTTKMDWKCCSMASTVRAASSSFPKPPQVARSDALEAQEERRGDAESIDEPVRPAPERGRFLEDPVVEPAAPLVEARMDELAEVIDHAGHGAGDLQFAGERLRHARMARAIGGGEEEDAGRGVRHGFGRFATSRVSLPACVVSPR